MADPTIDDLPVELRKILSDKNVISYIGCKPDGTLVIYRVVGSSIVVEKTGTTRIADSECQHEYEEIKTPSWDYEKYRCKKCGEEYKLWYNEMR